MKSTLRSLFLLFALCWITPAGAAARFGVCAATCTWDASSTVMWSTTSGGATGASVPGVGDDVTFDGSTCVGGVTCTITINTNFNILSLTTGACTASTTGCIIDFSANNNSPTISSNGWNNNNTGTRNIKCGSGTFSFTGTGANALNWGTSTNLTLTCPSATFAFSGASTNNRPITLGNTALTYPTITIAANSSGGNWLISGSNITAITALTFAAQNYIVFGNSQTYPITTITQTGASNSALTGIVSDNVNTAATISSANTVALSWTSIRAITFSGAGAKTATSSFDLGRNSGITITAPTSGGGSNIIGGGL